MGAVLPARAHRSDMRAVVLVLFLAFLSLPASAHSKDFVNATGDLLILPNDCEDLIGVSQGGVCFAGGHISPGLDGATTIEIHGDVSEPVSGCYQQGDRVCQRFCVSIGLAVGVNWDPSLDVLIFVDGPLGGGRLGSECGLWSAGPIGRVSHT